MTKQCVICEKKIIEKKDRWVRLTDFNKKEQVGEVFYHRECWRDRFRVSNSIRKQAMYNQANKAIVDVLKVLKSINPNPEKVFDIKQNQQN